MMDSRLRGNDRHLRQFVLGSNDSNIDTSDLCASAPLREIRFLEIIWERLRRCAPFATRCAMSSLSGKSILLTGAAKRLGAAIARAAHADGANVAIHYRGSSKAADALRDALNGARANSCIAIQADLLDT